MSGYGDDPIPAPRFASVNVVEALSVAQSLPYEALELAARAPARLAEPVLRVVTAAAAGQPLSDRDENLLFWGIHVLAEAREPRLFAPLLQLMRRPAEELEERLGDVITETFPRIAISVYDDGWPGFRSALLDPALNEFARSNLLLAMAYLAWAGHIERDEAHAVLLGLDRDRVVGSSDHSWYGWEEAIALLGFQDLANRVAAARAEGRLLEGLSSPEEFDATLAEALADPGSPARFEGRSLRPFGAAIDELEDMLASFDGDDDGDAPEPVRNPFRDVGRNEPCPCGSGRKFKKCCLASEAGQA